MTIRLDLPPWMILSFLFIVGAMIGSFLNVCIHRIPPHDRLWDQLRALWYRPSHCPRCGTNIRISDNIPIFGWLKLRGRCRHCRRRISPRYPLIELLNGCLWVFVFWLEVPLGFFATLEQSCVYTDIGPQAYPGLGWLSPEWFVCLRFFYHIILVEAMLVATFIDFDLRIIPDGSTIPAMIVAVLASWGIGRLHLVPVWFQDPNLELGLGDAVPEWLLPLLRGPEVPAWITAHPHLHGLVVSLVGFIVGGGIVWGVRLFGFWFLKQEAMGFGDVVLMAMVGSFLGWQASIIAFFIAPVFALSVVAVTSFFHRERMIPYGPYLSLGSLVTLLAWQSIFERTRHVFELGVLLVPVVLLMGVLLTLSLLIVQGGKWLLGIKLVEGPLTYWRPGDQTFFFKGEHVDRHSGNWKTRDWDGCASGQGRIHHERWRDATSGCGRMNPRWMNRNNRIR